MTPIQIFQSRHGARWAAIANGPELTDALLAVNQPLFDEITNLSAAEIASPSGNIILARLQGQLLHERALIDLSIIQPEQGDDLPPATYPDPALEAAEEARADQQDTATGAHHSSLLQEFIADQTVEPKPAPKKRRKRRKRKHASRSNSGSPDNT